MMSVSKVSDKRALSISNGLAVYYQKGKLYSGKVGENPKYLCSLPYRNRKEQLLSCFSLTERLFRLEPRFLLPIGDDRGLLSHNGSLYELQENTGGLKMIHSYRRGMNNPLNPCNVTGMPGFSDGVYYGEYWGNKNKEDVSIWRISNGEANKVYSFRAGQVRHIHALVPDYNRNQVIVLTGDGDEESNIWYTNDNFKTVNVLLGGDQSYRSCCAFVSGDSLIYATDTPLAENYIYKLNLITRERTVLKKICGPCIYCTSVKWHDKEAVVFATSVEPDSRLDRKKYIFSTEPSPYIDGRYSRLYWWDESDQVFELLKIKKDNLPLVLFQFGNIRFPQQDGKACFYYCPQSLKRVHGKTFIAVEGK